MGVEAVAASVRGKEALTNIDGVESFVFRGNPTNFQGETPSMQPSAQAYYDKVTKLLRTLHAMICSALGVEEDYFYAKGGIIPNMDIHSLKLSYYPSGATESVKHESEGEGPLRYGAHTDFEDLTILRPSKYDWMQLDDNDNDSRPMVQTTGGLQVYHQGMQRWVSVIVPDVGDEDEEEPLCVNLGDFWLIWSHGRYKSPLHRVTGIGFAVPRSEAKVKVKGNCASTPPAARKAVVFFSVPDDKVVIRPLPGTHPAPGTTATIYDGIERSAGEHLAIKLARINA